MTDELTILEDRARVRVGSALRGKYSLERLIGVGAMAAVYEGCHRNGMRVAVKVLHESVGTIPEVRRRFLREGYIANRIAHPGVVRVLDDDEDSDGTAFIAMELLAGQSLESEVRKRGGKLPLDRVLRIADQLLDVLDMAHEVGVVHRDLKPDNLFVLPDDGLKVLDFGIARISDGTSFTRSGQMMGTPEFVAPEQAGGRVREIDGRTDLFSVGAMMFTLLSGTHTHAASTPLEYMVYAATTPARKIATAMPELPEDIAHVIDVALLFDRESRWQNARAMRAALRSSAARAGVVHTTHTQAAAPSAGQDGRPAEATSETHAHAISSTATLVHGSAPGGLDATPLPARPKP